MAFLSKNAANFVKRIIDDPCDLDFWVYVETFLPAFLQLWITIVLIDLEDILRENAYQQLDNRRSARGPRGLRHGKPGFRGGKDLAVNRYSEKGLKTLLVLTEPLEKLGFALLLFHAVDEFYYEWSTLLDNRVCNEQDRGAGFQARRGGGAVIPNPDGGPVALLDKQNAYGGASVSAFGGSVPNGRYFVAFALSFTGERPLNG